MFRINIKLFGYTLSIQPNEDFKNVRKKIGGTWYKVREPLTVRHLYGLLPPDSYWTQEEPFNKKLEVLETEVYH